MRVLSLLAVVLSATSHAAEPSVAESTILGDWCAGSATAFHEEFSLTIEDGTHVFSSWLHQRPAESGTWALRGRTLTLLGRSGSDYVYSIKSVNAKRLVLQEAKEPPEVYVREGCRQFEEPPRERTRAAERAGHLTLRQTVSKLFLDPTRPRVGLILGATSSKALS
jgi:hypothetical protein